MKQKIIIIITIVLCSINQMSAQILDVYYKSNKAYENALIYGLNIQEGKDGKFGFANAKGKFIIQPIFDEVTEFKDNKSIVKYNGKFGIIDLHGNTIINPTYDEFIEYNKSAYLVKSNGLWGCIDLCGNTLIDTKFLDKPQKQTYIENYKTYAKECVIFKNKNESNGTCLLFCKNDKQHIINFQKHIHCKGLDFFLKEESYNKTDHTDILNENGILYSVTALRESINENFNENFIVINLATQSPWPRWALFKLKSGEIVKLSEGAKLHKINKTELIFKYESDCYDHIIYNDLTDEINIVTSPYDLKFDENIITHERGYGRDLYGIVDKKGNTIIPTKLSSPPRLIAEGIYDAILQKPFFINENWTYASIDGYYGEINMENNYDELQHVLGDVLQKSKLDTINITPLSFMLPPKYTSSWCKQPDNEYIEETVDGKTYTQPIRMFFYNSRNCCKYFTFYEQTLLSEKRYSEDEKMLEGSIIKRINDDYRLYLKIKDSAFKLDTLLLDESWFSFYAITPHHFAKLSNENTLFCFSGELMWRNLSYERDGSSKLFLLDTKNSKVLRTIDFKKYGNVERIFVSEDGFYLYSSSFIAKYNNDGDFIWDYCNGDYLLSFDENDKYLFITGYNTTEKYYEKPNPMFAILNKQTGEIIKREVENYKVNGEINHFWSNVVAVDGGYILQRQDTDFEFPTKLIKFNP